MDLDLEITPSLVNDMNAQLKDEKKVKEAMEAMGKKTQNKKQILQFKEMFPKLSEKEIEEILNKHQGNEEFAFDDLMEANSQREEEEHVRVMEETKKKREEEINRRIEELMNKFFTIPKEELREIFKKNNFDLQKTADELTQRIEEQAKQSQENLKKAETAMREKLRVYFIDRFQSLTKEEVEGVLEKHNFNKEKCAEDLMKKSRLRLFLVLKSKFALLDDDEIKECARKAEWFHPKAFKLCTLKQNLKSSKEVKKEDRKEKMEEKKKEEKKEERKEDFLNEEEDEKDIKKSSQVFIANFNHSEEVENDHPAIRDAFNKKMMNSLAEKPLEENNNNNSPQKEERKETKEEAKEEEGHSIQVEREGNKLRAKVVFPNVTSYSKIGLFKKTENDSNAICFQYIVKLKENTFECEVPKLNGEYEFRSFKSGYWAYTKVCTSKSIVVDEADSLLFSVQNEQNTVTVEWKIHSFAHTNAYVTVHFKREKKASAYRRSSGYLSSAEGSIKFKKLVHAGEYEARVYVGGVCKLISTSLEIKGI